MMTVDTLPEGFKPLPRLSKNSCFGCGPDNTMGLGMNFFSDGKSLVSFLTVPDHLCGWRNIVHGGIVATILDEIMGWSAIYLMKRVALTKRMSVEFLRPTLADLPLIVEGRVAKLADERHVEIQATLCTGKNEISARSEGLFTLFTMEDAVRQGMFEPEMIDEIFAGFLKERV